MGLRSARSNSEVPSLMKKRREKTQGLVLGCLLTSGSVFSNLVCIVPGIDEAGTVN